MAMLEVVLGAMLIFASLSLAGLTVASKNTLYTYSILTLSALLLFAGIRLMLGMFT